MNEVAARRVRALACLASLTSICVFGPTLGKTAHADGPARATRPSPDPIGAASAAYDKGTQAFGRHEYGPAADWFELANRLAPNALSLEGAIKAHRKIGSPGDLARSGTLALQLQASYADDPTAARFVQETLAALGPTFARVTVRCTLCVLEVDGVSVDSRDLFVIPGDHRLTAHWTEDTPPREQSQTVHAVNGATVVVDWSAPAPAVEAAVAANPAAAGAAPAPAPTSVSDAGSGLRTLPPGYTFAGIGLTAALGATAAIVWFADAKPNGTKLTTEAETTHIADPSLQSRVDSATHAAVGLDVATGVVGAATLVTALVFTRWKGEAPPVVVAPSADGRGGAGLSLRASF